jgi:hypothetical protein
MRWSTMWCLFIAFILASPEKQAISAEPGTFAAISEYTMFDQMLPDGKHPVWVYYVSGPPKPIIVRLTMPSMDMCVVTPESKRDMHIFEERSNHHLVKGSREWIFAEEVWQVAFKRYLLVGQPQRC